MLMGISRAFSHFLALSNAAENHHRVRKTRARLMHTEYGLSPKEDSCGGCIHQLIAEGQSKEDVYRAICSQSVEIVLTGPHWSRGGRECGMGCTALIPTEAGPHHAARAGPAAAHTRGNPNVTPEITLEVSTMSRWLAATLIKQDIKELRAQLSLFNASPELIAATNGAKEPYRAPGYGDSGNKRPALAAASLTDGHKNQDIADGLIIDIIRGTKRLDAIGFKLNSPASVHFYPGSESLGAYVISQCQQASDILAVVLLQQDAGEFITIFRICVIGTISAGMKDYMRVVPLFETLDDLERFRITEQGEVITQNLGRQPIAERTFDLFTAGLNVGSRPAKRNPKGGVESLRAIPWVFAWTQTRLNLPTWLGVGEAIMEVAEKDLPLLKEMYSEWPWFQTLIDLLEMILVKSEIRIAENYDNQLVHDEESRQLGKELRDRFKTTTEAVLLVSGNKELQSSNPILLQSMMVRNPYVDPLNVIQAELLRRLRTNDDMSDHDREVLMNSLLITINGVANGMRNSG
ncbi:unnamed protein product [Sphagnum jensenii]|uniref:Phosphoenolpyruvate carboxylase n=1 Tax=Sphagnum jensenii TaxID=128206 RepID=A0ABP0VLX1_9BRYO